MSEVINLMRLEPSTTIGLSDGSTAKVPLSQQCPVHDWEVQPC